MEHVGKNCEFSRQLSAHGLPLVIGLVFSGDEKVDSRGRYRETQLGDIQHEASICKGERKPRTDS